MGALLTCPSHQRDNMTKHGERRQRKKDVFTMTWSWGCSNFTPWGGGLLVMLLIIENPVLESCMCIRALVPNRVEMHLLKGIRNYIICSSC